MKVRGLFVCLVGLSMSSPLVAEQPEYEVAIAAGDPRVVSVRASVTLAERTLKMLPWGHPWLPHGWATFVEDLEVRDSAGQEVQVTRIEEEGWGSWAVDHDDGERLELTYTVRLDHDQYDWTRAGGPDSRPSFSNGALFLISRALFIYSPGVESATVTFDLPGDWQISTPWTGSANRPGTFLVDSSESLLSNAIVLGRYHQRTIDGGELKIELAVDDSLGDWADAFEETFETFLESYRQLFGGIPSGRYLVTLRAADEIDGESYHDSFNLITLPDGLEERRLIWANTLGHELFHYWNGANFLVGKEKSRVEWFGEGFTEYYSSLTLFRTGMIDQDLYFKKLERYLARYQITRQMWPTESLSLVEAGQDKGRNWLQIYGGGATVALALDLQIRSVTDGRRGLDEVMRLMKERFGDSGEPYDVEDVLRCVNDVSGEDFSLFFEHHVLGASEILDLPDLLAKAGLFLSQFADEFYLHRIETRSPRQIAVWTGWTRH